MGYSQADIARALKEKKEALLDWHKAKIARDVAAAARGGEAYDADKHWNADEYVEACEAVANDAEHTYNQMTKPSNNKKDD